MKLREVRDALSDQATPLSGALLRAKVLAALLKSPRLREYVDHELTGYREDELVPEYRHIPIGNEGTFVNPPHFTPVEAHPVPTADLPDKLKEWAETYVCTDSIGAIEKLLGTANDRIWMPWPHENVAFIPEVDIGGFGFRCTYASRCFSTENLQNILDNVRNRVLDIVLDLTEQFPEKDSENDLLSLPVAQVQTIVNNHIHGDYATIAAGGIVQQSVNVRPSDVDSLLTVLTRLGVAQQDQHTLVTAIEDDKNDAPTPTKLGPHVRKWLGDLATKAVEHTVEGGIAAALPHVIDALSKFFS